MPAVSEKRLMRTIRPSRPVVGSRLFDMFKSVSLLIAGRAHIARQVRDIVAIAPNATTGTASSPRGESMFLRMKCMIKYGQLLRIVGQRVSAVMNKFFRIERPTEHPRHNSTMFIFPNIRVRHLNHAIDEIAVMSEASASDGSIARVRSAGAAFPRCAVAAFGRSWAINPALAIALKSAFLKIEAARIATAARAAFGFVFNKPHSYKLCQWIGENKCLV